MQRPRKSDEGPGVPEALPRTIQSLARSLGVSEVDCLWLFPPLVKGRKEWGLVAASCFADGGSRRVVTARYGAERTGKGLTVDVDFSEEGIAPPDRLPRVMTGVSARSELGLGEARVVELGGRAEAYDDLLGEFDTELLEPEPEAPSEEPEPEAVET